MIGCSSSEMVGLKIGKGSSLEAARAAFDRIYPVVQEARVALAVQCCEHLNRALIVERETAERYGYEVVNVRPQPKAGGLCHHRLGAICPSGGCGAYPGQGGDGHRRYPHWDAPGEVAVPVRLSVTQIGQAPILCARTRPKFIGGERAQYCDEMK